MSNEILDDFFDELLKNEKEEKEKIISFMRNYIKKENNAKSIDKYFEDNLRYIILLNLPMNIMVDNILSGHKEFEIYKIELFDLASKKLLKVNTFLHDVKFYYVNLGREYFFISADDLYNMYYLNLIMIMMILQLKKSFLNHLYIKK